MTEVGNMDIESITQAAQDIGVVEQNIEKHKEDESISGVSFYALTEEQCTGIVSAIASHNNTAINHTKVKDDGGDDWPYSIHVGET